MSLGDTNGTDAEQFTAIASCSFSFVVLLTFFMFQMWRKLFMRLIFLISFCDCIANATVVAGRPDDYYLCFFQGFLQQIFYPASWLWTTVLAYCMYSLVMRGKISIREWKVHSFVWGVSLLYAVIPLSTDAYRRSPDDDHFCWISPRRRNNAVQWNTNVVWQVLSFEALLCTLTIIMLVWGYQMYRQLLVHHVECPLAVRNAVQALCMYPVLMVICWIPSAVVIHLPDAEFGFRSELYVTTHCIGITNGALSTLVFFYNSKEARDQWLNLLSCWCTDDSPKDERQISSDTLSTVAGSCSMSNMDAVGEERFSGLFSIARDTISTALSLPQLVFEEDNVYFDGCTTDSNRSAALNNHADQIITTATDGDAHFELFRRTANPLHQFHAQ